MAHEYPSYFAIAVFIRHISGESILFPSVSKQAIERFLENAVCCALVRSIFLGRSSQKDKFTT